MIRIKIRGFVAGRIMFEELVEIDDAQLDELLPQIAERHAVSMAGRPHMIEIEFLDEADPNERFFRFGTDPTGMVLPLAIDLSDEESDD